MFFHSFLDFWLRPSETRCSHWSLKSWFKANLQNFAPIGCFLLQFLFSFSFLFCCWLLKSSPETVNKLTGLTVPQANSKRAGEQGLVIMSKRSVFWVERAVWQEPRQDSTLLSLWMASKVHSMSMIPTTKPDQEYTTGLAQKDIRKRSRRLFYVQQKTQTTRMVKVANKYERENSGSWGLKLAVKWLKPAHYDLANETQTNFKWYLWVRLTYQGE